MKKFLVLLLTLNTQAATWYLDNAATGTGVGTSWVNAWTAPASVVWGASGVKAGDTLYVSGGTVSKSYTSGLTIGASGTVGNLINIVTGVDAGHSGIVVWENATMAVGSYKFVHVDGGSTTNMVFRNVTAATDYSAAITGSEGGHLIERVCVTNCPSGIVFISALTDGMIVQDCRIQWLTGKVGVAMRGEVTLAVYDKYILRRTSIEGVGTLSPAVGPDLVHVTAGSTVISNYFTYAVGTPVTDEHPDMIQQMGPRYVKICDNVFDGTIDSAVDIDFWFSGPTKGLVNVNIYNNLVKSTKVSRRCFQAFRFYSNYPTDVLTINGLRIFNNTLVDVANRTIGVVSGGAAFTVVNSLIQNNVLVNSAGIDIDSCTAYVAADWNVDYNVISAGASGSTTCTVDGSAYSQTHGSTSVPAFTSYSENAIANNLALMSSDTVARDTGVSLTTLTTTDALGVTRGTLWDRGAFEYTSGGVEPPVEPPVIKPSTPSGLRGYGTTR